MDADSATHSAASAAAATEEEEPLFSNLDLFLFSLIIGIVVYWFMSRKKPEPIPEFKKLDTPWVHVHVHKHTGTPLSQHSLARQQLMFKGDVPRHCRHWVSHRTKDAKINTLRVQTSLSYLTVPKGSAAAALWPPFFTASSDQPTNQSTGESVGHSFPLTQPHLWQSKSLPGNKKETKQCKKYIEIHTRTHTHPKQQHKYQQFCCFHMFLPLTWFKLLCTGKCGV